MTNTRLFQQTCLSSRQGDGDDDDDDDDDDAHADADADAAAAAAADDDDDDDEDDDDDDDDDEEPLQVLLYNHSVDILLQIYDSMHTHGWDDGEGCHTSCWAQALAPRGQLDLARKIGLSR